ncbi:MAG: hypothetical protein IID03_12080 [Candidatus Dadabacteria bacterium]|nr:hypothetical protein [Candidatus Dadabacteria bacterium]
MKLLDLLAHREWEKRFKEELENEMQMVFIKREEQKIVEIEYETIKRDMQQTSGRIGELMKSMRN